MRPLLAAVVVVLCGQHSAQSAAYLAKEVAAVATVEAEVAAAAGVLRAAERRLAEAMAKLSPEAQTAVRKMGTQLANMTKDETFNNAAEHLVSTAHSRQRGARGRGLVVLLPSLGCVSRSG